jgi:hypothetical protein
LADINCGFQPDKSPLPTHVRVFQEKQKAAI